MVIQESSPVALGIDQPLKGEFFERNVLLPLLITVKGVCQFVLASAFENRRISQREARCWLCGAAIFSFEDFSKFSDKICKVWHQIASVLLTRTAFSYMKIRARSGVGSPDLVGSHGRILC